MSRAHRYAGIKNVCRRQPGPVRFAAFALQALTRSLIVKAPSEVQPAALLLIGYGAIGRGLHEALCRRPEAGRVRAVVVRPESVAATRAQLAALPGDVDVVTDVASAPTEGLSLVVECAGHAGLRAHAPGALRAGLDVLVASVGALADVSIESGLRAAAAARGARVLVPSGALGGLDVLGAAALAGLDEVTCLSSKATTAWRGTAAETMIDLASVRQPTVFFRGSAREAAIAFPQNANVAAAVALAGLGFDRTRVELSADPGAGGNSHRILARGAFGQIDVAVTGRVLADNPKSSMLAPMSLLHAILKRASAIALA
jgi:aspartate dehydrogenase